VTLPLALVEIYIMIIMLLNLVEGWCHGLVGNRGKHHGCFIGCWKCGSLVAWVLKNTRETRWFILVRAIGTLRPAVRCSSCLGAPKSGGHNGSLVEDHSVLSYSSSMVRFLPIE
jgi:hypothetical protein